MAHAIDNTTGQWAVFTAGETPWHKLGVNVQQAQTSDEAIRLARLDWTVQQCGVEVVLPSGERLPIGSKRANVRSDTQACLGVVGDDYKPFHNREAFDFMDAIVGERLAMFETAGALKGGRRVWMLARLPQELRAAGNDTIQPYVLLTNSHDGTSSLRMFPTTVRVVCQNTLTLALGRAKTSEGLSITHTESLTRRVSEARANLGVIVKKLDAFSQQVQVLARRTLGREELASYFAGLVTNRVEKNQKKLLERFFDNLHNERNAMPEIRGSAWAAYNAVSEYADYGMTVHGQGLVKTDNRLNSIWFGAANELKQRAYQAALALAV